MPRATTAGSLAALGPFDLLHPLGRGGMGEVWAGRHRRSGRDVAVKVIRRPAGTSSTLRLALAREVRAVARLDHPGVVRVFDQGVVSRDAEVRTQGRLVAGTPYLVMERARTHLADSPPGPAWDQVAPVLDAILGALQHAHARKVLHRDLKPSNVLLDDHGAVRLADFGLARLLEGDADQPGGGTPRYMAPEQRAGRWDDEGPWTDLYALGCVLWELVCGGPPWFDAAGTPEAFHPISAVPRGLEEVARKLLAPRIGDRFSSATEAREALHRLEGDGPAPVAPGWRDLDRHRSLAHLGGAGLGVFAHRVHRVAGREAERDGLWSLLLASAQERRPRLVVLDGPSGIGKSRLAQWLCEAAEEAGLARSLRVVFARSPGPHDGWVPALSRELGCAATPRAELLGHLSAREPEAGLAAWSELAELLRPRGADEPLHGLLPVDLDPAGRLRVVREYLQRQARRLPVVLWLDDAHHDAQTAAVARALLDAADAPILVLATCRGSEGLDPRGSRMTLASLPSGDVGGLVHDLLGLSPGLRLDIERRSEGNPLFAVQLVADWVARQLLVDTADGFAPAPEADLGIPDALHALWADRVEQALSGLPVEAREVVELAALLGTHVDLHEWERLCGARAEVALELLERLAHAELVQLDNARWSFTHGLLVESIRRIAEEAGRAEAQRVEVGGFLVARARADLASGRALAAATTLDRARDLAADHPSLLAETLGLLGATHKRLGRPDVAEALLTDALGRHRALGERAHACAVLTHLGDLYAQRGRPVDGARVLDEACALAEALGDPALRAPALGNKASALHYMGDNEGAAALYGETIALLAALGNRREEGIALGNLGSLRRTQGRLAEAEPLLHAALAAHREVGNRRSEGVVLGNLASLRQAQGRVEEGERLYHSALALHRELGNRRSEGLVLGNLGNLLTQRGDFAAARATYAEALALHRGAGERRSEGIVHFASAMLDLAEGHLDRARQGLEEALVIHRSVLNRSHEASTLGALGDVSAAQGDAQAAREHFARALGLYRELGELTGVLEALGSLGKLAHAEGEDPWPRLDEALEVARGLGGSALLAELCIRARIQVDRGDLGAARATIGEARALGTTLPAEVAAGAFLELDRLDKGL